MLLDIVGWNIVFAEYPVVQFWIFIAILFIRIKPECGMIPNSPAHIFWHIRLYEQGTPPSVVNLNKILYYIVEEAS